MLGQVRTLIVSQDVEQLLNAYGISSLGSAHLLQNLHALASAAESGLPHRGGTPSALSGPPSTRR